MISDFQAAGYERALGVCAAATTWWRCTCATRARRSCRRRGSWPSPIPETGERIVADTSRPEVRRAPGPGPSPPPPPAFRKTRVDALALSTAESYERPLPAFFKARERRR